MLIDNREYIKQIVNNENKTIYWPDDSSKTYVKFLLCHEIAHIEYATEFFSGSITGKSSKIEES